MMQDNRIIFMDAARGTAMLFVFLNHFVAPYLFRFESDTGYRILAVTMIASPSFIAISGMMLGYLYQRGVNFQELRARFIDRGLFMLTAGHILISFAHTQFSTRILHLLYGWQHITDMIGFCICVGPFLVGKMKPSARFVLALFIFIFSWLAILFFHPQGLGLRFLKETTVGSIDQLLLYSSFPFLPWLSFYLFNTFIGEKIAIYQRNQSFEKISKTFLVLGSTFLLLALSLNYGYKMLHASSWASLASIPSLLTSRFQKSPPSPVYFLAYGSMCYFMLFMLFRFRAWRVTRFYAKVSSILGRNSLFAFILQFYVYYTLLFYLDLPYSPFWPVYFVVSAVFIIGAAHLWERKRLNRFFTLGTSRFWKRTFENSYGRYIR
jgi:uncharacterized membrane protein